MSLFNQKVRQILHTGSQIGEDIFSLFSKKIEEVRLCISSDSCLFIEKSYKKICQSLMYILKFLSGNVQKTLKDHFYQCFCIFDLFIRSTQPEKYGHRFPLISYLTKKFQTMFQVQENLILSTREKYNTKNVWSQKKEVMQVNQITMQELNFLKSKNTSTFFVDLVQDEIKVQNFQCVCCCQVFIRDQPINNANPLMQSVVDLQKKNINKLILERYISSICNQGNGVLIIGAQKKDRNLYSVGIKFKSLEEISDVQRQISSAIQNMRPKIFYVIQRVPVHSNFVNEHENHLDEHLRLCLRVIIYTSVPRFLTYIQYFKKGCESSYQIYNFDKSFSPVQVKPSQFYDKVHQFYQKRKNFVSVNSHQGILCCHPYLQYSKAFKNEYKLKGLPENVEQAKQQNIEQSHNQTKVFDDEPKYKYKNMSLIVINSKKHDRYVLVLEDYIKSNKKRIEIAKPFQKSFSSNSGRSIWIASHEPKFSEVKGSLALCQQQRSIKQGALKIMPVTKKLFIEAEKLSQYHQNLLKTKFKERYGMLFIKDVEKSSTGQTLQLSFDSYSESIYAFMLLQQMQVRGRFMNDIHKQFCHY